MGRSSVVLDEIGCLVQATGCGDGNAFATLYDRTASVMFGLIQHASGDSAAVERAMVRVYVRVWRTAPAFDPTVTSGGAFLMDALYREFDGRERRDHARCARARRASPDGRRVSPARPAVPRRARPR